MFNKFVILIIVFGLTISSLNCVKEMPDFIDYSPASPQLVTPVDGKTGLDTKVYFAWLSANGADSYNFYISETASFYSDSTLVENIADTAIYFAPLKKGVKYFWYVTACNDGPRPGYSQIYSFTTAP